MRVKILNASINNRRREFEIELRDRGVLTFPYHRAEPPPTRDADCCGMREEGIGKPEGRLRSHAAAASNPRSPED